MEGVGDDRQCSHPHTVVLREDVLFLSEVFVCCLLGTCILAHACTMYFHFPRGSEGSGCPQRLGR